MQETITQLRQQLESLMSNNSSRSADSTTRMISFEGSLEIINEKGYDINSFDETSLDENTPTSAGSLNRIFNHEDAKACNGEIYSKSQLVAQVCTPRLCVFSGPRAMEQFIANF